MSTSRSLYLCRTPFQLLMCQKIVALFPDETADLCYMTNPNGDKDRYYVARASDDFARTEYRALGPKFDIAAFVVGLRWHWIGTTSYDRIYIANHTLSHFRFLLKHHSGAEVRTFDEGSGNFDPQGELQVDGRSAVERLRDVVLGIPPIHDVFSQSVRHYTVNAKLPNVVDANRLLQLDLIDVPRANEEHDKAVNLVIGQPFEEHLDDAQQATMLDAFSAISAGRYILHPRETNRSELLPNLEVISDKRIIEDYICDLVSEGFRVRLMGPFSTTFFTVNSPLVEKHYLHISSYATHPGLAAQVGCEVFDLHEGSEQARWAALARSWDEQGDRDASKAS